MKVLFVNFEMSLNAKTLYLQTFPGTDVAFKIEPNMLLVIGIFYITSHKPRNLWNVFQVFKINLTRQYKTNISILDIDMSPNFVDYSIPTHLSYIRPKYGRCYYFLYIFEKLFFKAKSHFLQINIIYKKDLTASLSRFSRELFCNISPLVLGKI